MTRFEKIAILVTLMLLLFGYGIWYLNTYSMLEIERTEINEDSLPSQLLIVSQGSEYKDSVLLGLIDHFKQKAIYIKVIDVQDLDNIDANEWDAICLLHTWEMWKPPSKVAQFMKTLGTYDKLVVHTTSGDGNYQMEDVDGITGASVRENIKPKTKAIIIKIEDILNEKENISYQK